MYWQIYFVFVLFLNSLSETLIAKNTTGIMKLRESSFMFEIICFIPPENILNGVENWITFK